MFYIGFKDEPTAQIGLARSRDGISNWQRHPAQSNRPVGTGKWDQNACYSLCDIQRKKMAVMV